MENEYTIFFGDKPYYIINKLTEETYELTKTAGTIIINQPDSQLITKTIRDMALPGTRAVIVLTNSVEYNWKVFQDNFRPITAGGGIVKNEKDAVLFIYRRGKWDLPKGKLDEGETIEACAIREVMEETGLKKVNILKQAGNTYHTYFEGKKHMLKTSVWFFMQALGGQELIPQTEEDIESMEWLPKTKWPKAFENTYPAIKLILKK
jgi:8-oxo-dGTP pyrophosphatase MutT (NUDIX family)